jgi:hypothetical protein
MKFVTHGAGGGLLLGGVAGDEGEGGAEAGGDEGELLHGEIS